MLFWILLATIFDSLLAFVGAFTLIFSKEKLRKLIFSLVAFSSGALLGGAFFHMLSESLEYVEKDLSFILLIFGFSLFFLMERILKWHHCHEEKCDVHSFTYLILLGDGIHNFIDGLVIGASFLVSFPLGVVTTILIIAHEVPQELGDFGVLLYGGFKPKTALFWNFISQLTCVLGGLLIYFFSPISSLKFYLLPFAAGGFIYISASDLIPELHKEKNLTRSLTAFALFIIGLLFIYGIKFLEI